MTTTVLIADDTDWSAVTLEILILGIPGTAVVRAADGEAALRVLAHQEVSALVTDLRMPQMDGFELIKRVRALKNGRPIPIIVVSAEESPEARSKAQQLGVDAYFVKPYSPAAVQHALETLLNSVNPSEAVAGSAWSERTVEIEPTDRLR